jgi:hypothetical protein
MVVGADHRGRGGVGVWGDAASSRLTALRQRPGAPGGSGRRLGGGAGGPGLAGDACCPPCAGLACSGAQPGLGPVVLGRCFVGGRRAYRTTLRGNQARLRLPPQAARTVGPPEGADAPYESIARSAPCGAAAPLPQGGIDQHRCAGPPTPRVRTLCAEARTEGCWVRGGKGGGSLASSSRSAGVAHHLPLLDVGG